MQGDCSCMRICGTGGLVSFVKKMAESDGMHKTEHVDVLRVGWRLHVLLQQRTKIHVKTS